MTLADTMNGPIWILYFITVIFIIIAVILISGHGSWLIAGYNTAPEAEKEKYNKRKLCQVTGIGIGFIAVLLVIVSLFYKQLPANFIYFFVVFIVADTIIILILNNTICKKR